MWESMGSHLKESMGIWILFQFLEFQVPASRTPGVSMGFQVSSSMEFLTPDLFLKFLKAEAHVYQAGGPVEGRRLETIFTWKSST